MCISFFAAGRLRSSVNSVFYTRIFAVPLFLIAWTQTRQTNGYLEAINGLLQAAKR